MAAEQSDAEYTRLCLACGGSRLDLVNTILEGAGGSEIEIDNLLFQQVCADGETDIAVRLLELTGKQYVNVHADSERAFRAACRYGRADVARMLLQLTGTRAVNVHAKDEYALRYAFANRHQNIVDMLLLETSRPANPDVVKKLGLGQRLKDVVGDNPPATVHHEEGDNPPAALAAQPGL